MPAARLRGSFSLGDGMLNLWDQLGDRHLFNKHSRLFRSGQAISSARELDGVIHNPQRM